MLTIRTQLNTLHSAHVTLGQLYTVALKLNGLKEAAMHSYVLTFMK